MGGSSGRGEAIEQMQSQPDPLELVARATGSRPVSTDRQRYSNSGNAVYRVSLDNGQSICLRISPRPRTFAYTAQNLDILRSRQIPVQRVIAAGSTAAGGSFILLTWLPGCDLLDELPTMTAMQMTAAAERIAECQRRLATLPAGSGFGWAPIGHAAPVKQWTDTFGPPHAELPPEDGSAMSSLRRRLCQLRARLEPYFARVRPACFLDDLTTKNAIFNHGVFAGVIDADYACYGDPLLSVGATLASLVADMNTPADSYGNALVRAFDPTSLQRLALSFYTALWLIGILSLTDSSDTVRAARIIPAAQRTLSQAESDGNARLSA